MHQNQVGELFATRCQLGGKWSGKKENLHINVLELIAAKFEILRFTKGQSIYSNSLADRQQDYTFISFENGGYTQQRTLAHQQVHLELHSQQTNCYVCTVPSQCSKCTCRLGIRKCQGQFRMETRYFSFPRDYNTHGTTNSGSVCIQTLPPTSSIHCMETRPGQYSNRCIPASLGQGVRFCFSSIQLDKSGSKEDPRRKNRSSTHSDTHMANSALVFTSKNVCTANISSTSNEKFVNKSTGQKSSSSRNRVTEISSVEGFRESLQMEGISSNPAKLISYSGRKSLTTNYESAWGQWTSWYNERQVNPFQAPVNYIINFLSEKFDKGLQYRTLNSLRSAISAYHAHIDGKSVGGHPKVRTLLAGIFNERPPQPRCFIWDEEIVLQYIRRTHWYDNSSLNPLSAKFIKWSNKLKQFVGKLPTNCLSVFDHFVGLALKGLMMQT